MNILYSLSVIASVFFLPPEDRHLYLDPGSGSFILQLAIATLLGGIFVLKAYWQKLLNLFRKDKQNIETIEDPEEPEDK